jgi:inositol transport system permease protein
VVGVGTHVVLNNTRFARYIYAIGGNEQAVQVSGLNISRAKVGIYTFAGLLSGLSGIVLSSRISSGQPGLGMGLSWMPSRPLLLAAPVFRAV